MNRNGMAANTESTANGRIAMRFVLLIGVLSFFAKLSPGLVESSDSRLAARYAT